MKTLETNLNGSPHPNSLMPLTWYPISISHILPSPVLSHYSGHAVAFVPCLHTFLMGIFFTNSLVYSVCLFLLTLSFHALFGVSFQKLSKLLFILILDFLTHTFRSQKIKKILLNKEKTKPLNLIEDG